MRCRQPQLSMVRCLTVACGVSMLAAAGAGSAVHAQRPAQTEGPASFMSAFELARHALGAGDHAAVRDHLRTALVFAPDYPIALYYLARSEAQLGDTAAALATLERLARQGAVRDLAGDTALAPLHGSPRFAAVSLALAQNTAPLIRSAPAFTLADPDFIPEGLAYDHADGFFYVGSLNGRGVLRLQRNGLAVPFLSAEDLGGASVAGLRVDPRRRLLWLAALVYDSTAPAYARGVGARAALRAFDLTTGALRARHHAPQDGAPHLLNDIVVTPAGDLYVTDSEAGALYRLTDGAAALERVHGDDPNFTYPNGIAVSADGTRLFVAHMEGVSSIQLGPGRSGRLERLNAPPGVATTGIDGMYMCGEGLLAVQSLLGFQQVTLFRIDAEATRITDAVALERNHPAHDAATTGAFVDDDFFYIASAQLRRLQPDGTAAAAEPATPSTVLRLPLDGSCR